MVQVRACSSLKLVAIVVAILLHIHRLRPTSIGMRIRKTPGQRTPIDTGRFRQKQLSRSFNPLVAGSSPAGPTSDVPRQGDSHHPRTDPGTSDDGPAIRTQPALPLLSLNVMTN